MICGGGLAALGNSLPPDPTSTPVAQQHATNTPASGAATATATNTAQPKPTATTAHPPTSTPNHSTGHPFVGGSYDAFVNAYGQPFMAVQGGEDFYADNAQTIVLLVSPGGSGTMVTHINVSASPDLSDSATFTLCSTWLPDGATEYNAAGPNYDFHSSVGEVVLSNYGSGACVLQIAGS